jgi:hypothetical protein
MDHSNRTRAFHPKSVAPATASEAERASQSAIARAEKDAEIQIPKILEVLRRGERFMVCSHARPDGDAVGSILAMGMLLEQLGKHADLVMSDRIPNIYMGLPGTENIRLAQHVDGPYDAVILLECDGLERANLRGLKQFFLVNIDHHVSGQEYGKLNWIDHSAVSVGELVFKLAKAAGATITPEMATCLYTTVLTDTGGFCYGAMKASTFGMAQELVAAGADPMRIAQEVYFAAAGLGAGQFKARRPAGMAVGHPSGCGASLCRRGGLRGHSELCAVHQQGRSRSVFARAARPAHQDWLTQQGLVGCGRGCRATGRGRP